MKNISLYRKYRPSNLAEIVGQDIIKTILKNTIKKNRIFHSYIFSGSYGIGKTSIARIFAKMVNCLKNIDGDCCNNCDNCNLINNSITGDIIEIDAASNNGVEDMREIINSVYYLPQNLIKKIFIIDEAHMLTSNAWNALLKTLEEPPKHIIFIFATTDVCKIPLNIISRSQRFDFNKLSFEEILKMINDIIKKENYEIDQDSVKLLVKIANGSMRDAISMLDQVVNFNLENEDISVDNILKIFGLASIDIKIDIIVNISLKNFDFLISTFNDLEKKGVNFLNLQKEILEILVDKIIYNKTRTASLLKILNAKNVESINISSDLLYKMVDILECGYSEIKNNFDEKFFFEVSIWKCVSLFEDKLEDKQTKKVNDKIIHENTNINSLDNKLDKQNNNIPILDSIDELQNDFSEIKKNEFIEAPFYELIDIELNDEEDKYCSLEKEPSVDETQEYDIEENIFFQIAFNNKKEQIEKISSILEKIKSNRYKEKPISEFICDAKKVLLASNNAIVLLFSNELKAKNLNRINKEKEFLQFINKKFDKIYYIIGIYQDLSKLRNKFVELKSSGVRYDDYQLEELEVIIKKTPSIKEIALDIFKDEIKGEN
ncbi:MAG: DNA polymerase III subunit gamma/tau [Mycoplasmoidaceae bacterium]